MVAGGRGLSGELQRSAGRNQMFRFVVGFVLVEPKAVALDGPKAICLTKAVHMFHVLRTRCYEFCCGDGSPNVCHWFCCLVVAPVCDRWDPNVYWGNGA